MKFRVKKYIVATKYKNYNGELMHFISSDKPIRRKSGKEFCAVDGIFVPSSMLPDLQYDEVAKQEFDGKTYEHGIPCMLEIDTIPFDGAKEMWCFGWKSKCRRISPYEPQNLERTPNGFSGDFKDGTLIVSSWCEKEYFQQIELGTTFKVYVKVRRQTEEEKKLYK